MLGRAEQIAAMRQLLLVLEAHPELEMPYNWGTNEYNRVSWFLHDDQVGQLALIPAVIGGDWERNEVGSGESIDAQYVRLDTQFAGGLHLGIMIPRKSVEKYMREQANDD